MYNATLTGPAYVYTAPTPVFDIIDEPDVVDEVIVVPPDPLVFTEITGTAGNDVLPWNFSVGNAIIDGGDGFDTVAVDAYDSSSTTFSLNSSGGSVDLRVGGFILDISNVEALDIVGGSGTDSITVGNLDDTAITDNSVTFSGGGGNDILSGTYASKRLVAFGGQGDDTLITGSADDFLSGGEGADFLSGGAGNDSLYGGNGFDTMQVDEAQGAIVNFNTGTATGSEGNTDQFSSIESVIGSSYDDVFIASYSTGNLVIDGSGGDDTLAIYGNPSSGSTFVVEEFNGDVLIESSSQLITADGVEDLHILLGAGDDTVLVGDLSATDIDPETVTVSGGGGDDFIVGSGELPINQTTNGIQEDPSIAQLTGGNTIVVWMANGQDGGGDDGIFARLTDSDGLPIGDEFQVNSFTTGAQNDPKVVALSDGGFVAVWQSADQDGDSFGVFGQRFDASGSTVGSEFRVNSETADAQLDPSIATLDSGGFVVAWSSLNQEEGGTSGDFGVFAQRFDVSGTTPTAAGSEIQINTETADRQGDSAVAGLEDVGSGGGFVVAWSSGGQDGDGNGVFAQLFNSSGSAVGGEIAVNGTTTDFQEDPTVTALDDGGFVVVWVSGNQDGDGDGVFGQRFNAAGTKVGGEFLVNSETTDDQNDPEATTLADGSFVVSWNSDEQDGHDYGIFAQRFDTTGTTPTAIGDEIAVNAQTFGYQDDSAITSLAYGGFAVAWETHGERYDGLDEDVRVQRFYADGEAVHTAATGSLVLEGGSGNDILIGGLADDVLDGGDDDDELAGFTGDDVLFGGNGSDVLYGNADSDILDGGAGNDIIDGGEGITVGSFDTDNDTATFSGATTGIDVNLLARAVYVDGQGGSDVIYGIETVIGTDYSDVMRGDNLDNTLIGGAGGDTLYGGSGEDFLEGGLGDDNLYGEYGDDVVLGGGGDDRFYDSGFSTDTLDGGDGNDILGAEGGYNLMIGGAGDDTINGGYNADVIFGDGATSLLNGLGGDVGFGEDSLPRSDDGSQEVDISGVFESGLNIGGSTFTEMFINDNGNLTFGDSLDEFDPFVIDGDGAGFYELPIIAAFFADVETSPGPATATPGGTSTGSNLIYFDSDVATDTFTVTWDDVGYFSDNIDLLNAFQISLVDQGSGDFDIIIRYEDINWTTGDASGGSGGLGGIVARAGVSAANGTDFFELTQSGNQADMLGLDEIGSFTFEFRSGSLISSSLFIGGDDILSGGAGDDTIDGGGGNDIIQGGTGNDTLLGQAGDDTLTDSNGDNFLFGGDGDDFVQTTIGSSNLYGDAGDDSLYGGSGDDLLNGGADNDVLVGGAGNDTLIGGSGIDTAKFFDEVSGVNVELGGGTVSGPNTGDDQIGGAGGDDTLDGGAGNDYADFYHAAGGVVVDLSTSSASVDGDGGSDTLISLENVYGSNFDDVIDGDSGGNILKGFDGIDTLDGGLGNDVLDGGDGNDILTDSDGTNILSGDGGDDFLQVSDATANLYGGDGNDTLIMDYSFGEAHGGNDDDVIRVYDESGVEYDATIYSDAGDDLLYGGYGDDFIDGGADNDYLYGYEGNDILNGGTGDDTLIAGDGDDILDGGFGSDTLFGNLGSDNLDGGDGDDTLDGGYDSDALFGGTGNDALDGGYGDDTLYGDGGDDLLLGGYGSDLLDGGGDNDTLNGGYNDDTLFGGAGNDTLDGGDGADTMYGGSGDDLFIHYAGGGSEYFYGEGDIDTITFAGYGGGVSVDLEHFPIILVHILS